MCDFVGAMLLEVHCVAADRLIYGLVSVSEGKKGMGGAGKGVGGANILNECVSVERYDAEGCTVWLVEDW